MRRGRGCGGAARAPVFSWLPRQRIRDPGAVRLMRRCCKLRRASDNLEPHTYGLAGIVFYSDYRRPTPRPARDIGGTGPS